MFHSPEEWEAIEPLVMGVAFNVALLVLWFVTAVLILRHVPFNYGH